MTALLHASSAARQQAAAGGAFARLTVANFVAYRELAETDADGLTEEEMFDAVVPLIHAVVVREVKGGHSRITPLLDVAREVVPDSGILREI